MKPQTSVTLILDEFPDSAMIHYAIGYVGDKSAGATQFNSEPARKQVVITNKSVGDVKKMIANGKNIRDLDIKSITF